MLDCIFLQGSRSDRRGRNFLSLSFSTTLACILAAKGIRRDDCNTLRAPLDADAWAPAAGLHSHSLPSLLVTRHPSTHA